MSKRMVEPNTTFYPVAVALITSGGETPNVMTANRLVSASAEPPRLALSVRPARHSHRLIKQTGEFVVNRPTPDLATLVDYAGVVTGRKENKIDIAGLRLTPAQKVKSPLLADCPVNIECIVEQEIELDSHIMFIGRVEVIHIEEELLDAHGEIDLSRAQGITYDSSIVRERPTYPFRLTDLRRAVQMAAAANRATVMLKRDTEPPLNPPYRSSPLSETTGKGVPGNSVVSDGDRGEFI